MDANENSSLLLEEEPIHYGGSNLLFKDEALIRVLSCPFVVD